MLLLSWGKSVKKFRSYDREYKQTNRRTYWCTLYTGCPTKHDSSKTIWKSSLIFEFIWDIQSSIFSHNYLETITTQYGSPGIYKLRYVFFVRSILPWYWEFRSVFNCINYRTKIVEIWTKLIISPVILRAQKSQTTFWKSQN